MRQVALLTLLILSIGCEEREAQSKSNNSPDSDVPPAYVSVDTTDGKQFRVIIQEGGSNISISESELNIIDSLLLQQIQEHNLKTDTSFFINLSKYKRQYFPSVNANGEMEVEVNCFCRVHNNNDWKKQRVQVDDGGICFFNFKINVATRHVLRFRINGEA